MTVYLLVLNISINIFYIFTEAPPVLRTEVHLTRWEKVFERTHTEKLDVLKDRVMREKMLTVIGNSKECDTRLLR